MLTTLRIKNLALVTDLTLEFQPGYNVITGETGAGKSILIGALSLVLESARTVHSFVPERKIVQWRPFSIARDLSRW